jgi:hypothetical protein
MAGELPRAMPTFGLIQIAGPGFDLHQNDIAKIGLDADGCIGGQDFL